MYSFSFPNMLGSVSAKLNKDKAAVRSNLRLLLASERASLFGDPYFGCELKKYLYEQSTMVIQDLIIDHIYTAIVTFMPQVFLKRTDIKVLTYKNQLAVSIQYQYVVDNTSDLYVIQLTSDEYQDSTKAF